MQRTSFGSRITWLCLAAVLVGAPAGSVVRAQASAGRAAAPATGVFTLITEPDQGMAPIYTLLSGARKSVDLVMYEFDDTKAETLLAKDAARGVKVRVILNKAQNQSYNQAAFNYLRGHGVKVRWASNLYLVTHQKSFVVDGATAVIMTLNFTSQYYATSRDFALVDTDANDVAAIEQVFAADFKGEIIAPAPTGDDLLWSPGSETATLNLINAATKTIDVYNEEMAEPTVTAALVAAAKRGVTVEVCMTNSASWTSAFDQLTAAGVKVRTYASDQSPYIHAKMVLVDAGQTDQMTFLGSENFSNASLQGNRELGVVISDTATLGSLNKTFAKDWKAATMWK